MSRVSSKSLLEPLSWDEAVMLFPKLNLCWPLRGAYGLDANGDLWCVGQHASVDLASDKAKLVGFKWDGAEWQNTAAPI